MFDTEYEAKLQKSLNKLGIVIKYEHIDRLPKDQFAKARNSGFGASDSAKLLNVSPFGTKLDLVREKANETHDEEISKKASVRKGSQLEPIILQNAEELLKATLYAYYNENIHIHKPYNMYGQKDGALNINFDGVLFIGDVPITVVEAKLVTKYGRKYYNFNKAYLRTVDGAPDVSYINDIEKPDTPVINAANVLDICTKLADYYGIPIYYYTQVQQQLLGVTNDFGYLAVVDDDNWEVYIFKVYRNEQLISLLKTTGVAAWAMVTAMKK